jgi:hypothetical protein
MKAAFTKNDVSNAINYSGNKETVNQLRAIIVNGKDCRELVDARFYMGRSSSASSVYCSVWICGADKHISGRGTASGYGYHKQSAALASAFSSAGVEFYGSAYGEPRRWDHNLGREKTPAELKAEKRKANKTRCNFDGAGDSAMRAAVKAAAVELKRIGKIKGRIFIV